MALPFRRFVLALDLIEGFLTSLQIIVAGVIYGHVSAKYIYVRIFRGTKHMGKRTWLALGSWAAITLTLWVVAWIIAERYVSYAKS